MRKPCKNCIEASNGKIMDLYYECCQYCPYGDIDITELTAKDDEDKD